MPYIDTHSHFYVNRLTSTQAAWMQAARQAGIEAMILCSGGPSDWQTVISAAHTYQQPYMLGVHPFFVHEVTPATLPQLRALITRAMQDPLFVGIGEIGLDKQMHPQAETVFIEMLKLARDFDLAISVHCRQTADRLQAAFKRVPPVSGAIHAFNGSDVDRQKFIELGLKLGFGGAVTYEGSQRIRKHLAQIDPQAYVLETDCPDIPNAERRDRHHQEGEPLWSQPVDIVTTARVASELRHESLATIEAQSYANALQAFGRLSQALSCREGA